jgi:putative ABC transport system permease protein
MLELVKVNKKIKNKIILNNISYTFPNNGIVCIFGPSGAGKSSLLHLIGGIDNKASGEVLFDNKNILTINTIKRLNYIKHQISYIFQDNQLISFLSITDNLNLLLTTEDKQKYAKILKINNILDKPIYKLSGGQKIRVSLLRSFCKESSILLADEPTGALDYDNATLVMSLLKEIAKEKLVIIVSHNLELVEKYANEVIYLENGNITNTRTIQSVPIKNNSVGKIKHNSSFISSIKYAYANLKDKKINTILCVFFTFIGLLGIVISFLLEVGFSSYFQHSSDDLNNLDGIFMYEKYRDTLLTPNQDEFNDIRLKYNLIGSSYVLFPSDFITVDKTTIQGIDVHLPVAMFGLTELIYGDLKNNEIGMYLSGQHYDYIAYLLGIDSPNDELINEKLKSKEIYVKLDFTAKYTFYRETLLLKNVTKSNKIGYYHNEKDFLYKKFNTKLNYDVSNTTNFLFSPYLYTKKADESILIREIDFDFIFNQKIHDSLYVSFIYKSLSKRFFFSDIDEYINEKVSGFVFQIQDVIGPFGNFLSGEFVGELSIDAKQVFYKPLMNARNISGEYPTKSELIISKGLYDILNTNNIIFKWQNKTINFIVSGVSNSTGLYIYSDSFDFFSNLIDNLQLDINNLYSPTLTFFTKDPSDITYLIETYQTANRNAIITSPYFQIQSTMHNIIDIVTKVINILSYICIANAILLIGVLFFRNIVSQERNITILRTLGYSKLNVFLIFICESVFIGGLSFAFTALFSFIASEEINMIFKDLLATNENIFTYDANILLNVGKIIIVISLIIGVVPSLALFKKNLLTSLKN